MLLTLKEPGVLKLGVEGSSALRVSPGCGQKQQVSVYVTTNGCAAGCRGAAAFGGAIWAQCTSAQLCHCHDLPRWEQARHDERGSEKGLRVPGTWLLVPRHWCLSPPAGAATTALETCPRNHYFWLLCSVKNLGFCSLCCQIWKDCGMVLSCVMALVNPEVLVQQKSIYKMSLVQQVF